MKKIKTLVIIFIFCLFPTISCNAATRQINIKITTTYRIIKGEKIKLYVKGYKNNKKVKWKSSNKKIASVSKKGVVTGKKGGTVKITATIGKKKFKTKVTVFTGESIKYKVDVNPAKDEDRYHNDITVTKINKEKKTLYVGQTFALKITGTNKKIKWKSSDNAIATVSSSGKVTAVQEGSAIITASFEDGKYIYKHTCKIIVTPQWLNQTDLESKYDIFIANYDHSYHFVGSSDSSSTGIASSALVTDVPETMEINKVYGTDITYKYNGTDILFNLKDLAALGII